MTLVNNGTLAGHNDCTSEFINGAVLDNHSALTLADSTGLGTDGSSGNSLINRATGIYNGTSGNAVKATAAVARWPCRWPGESTRAAPVHVPVWI